MKKRVIGIGGLFFKTKDPEKMQQWYKTHLGFDTTPYGTTFHWGRENGGKGHTVWSTFKEDTNYFAPSGKDYMFNYRVENLEELLKALKEEGVEIVGEMQVFDYGKFGWIMDPEGNKIELWEPVDDGDLGSSTPSN